jgi:hypothetical protein
MLMGHTRGGHGSGQGAQDDWPIRGKGGRESSFCQWEWKTGQALIRATVEVGQVLGTNVFCP